MDRRSWLWRQKSLVKIPAETTESSGSISFISGRYFDHQEVLKSSSTDVKAVEVSSNTAISDDQHTVKELRVKLSTAIANHRAKEELVQQHAKVAEDAVSGWEKSEFEVVSLKQQVEAANQKNFTLQDRNKQLDGALKECIKQLQLAREEHEEKVHSAVVEKISEWMDEKLELQSRVLKMETQLEARNSVASENVIHGMQLRLSGAEKENSDLKRNIAIQSEKIRAQNLEVELSNQAAEAASKQHLASIKKVAKAESECRMLRAVIRKSQSHSGQKPFLTSAYVESLPNSMMLSLNDATNCKEASKSDLKIELNHAKSEKRRNGENLLTSFLNTGIMDDFLAMEKLLASHKINQSTVCSTSNTSGTIRSQSADKLEAAFQRTSELENKIIKLESEKEDLAGILVETQERLENSLRQMKEVENEVMELQKKLDSTYASKQVSETATKVADAKRKALELQVEVVDSEVQQLREKVLSLEQSVDKERKLVEEFAIQCQKLENELSKKREVQVQQAAISVEKLKVEQEKDLAAAAKKFAVCQQTIASLGLQLKSLANLENFNHESWNPDNESGIVEERNLFCGSSLGSFDDLVHQSTATSSLQACTNLSIKVGQIVTEKQKVDIRVR